MFINSFADAFTIIQKLSTKIAAMHNIKPKKYTDSLWKMKNIVE